MVFDGYRGFQTLSLLDNTLSPKVEEEVQSSYGKMSSKAQLTIFYSGFINVFNDVPLDKAQAIMQLAMESSLEPPMVKMEMDTTEALSKPYLSSVSKFQAGLPIARKNSLQRFLEKRRLRILSKAPYVPRAKFDDQQRNNQGYSMSSTK